MRLYKIIIISVLLFSTAFVFFSTAQAQLESEDEAAEVTAVVEDIPSIKVTEWTSIDVTLTDTCGIPWERFKDMFMAKYLWPVFHPSWRPYLGYTSLQLKPEIIEGDPNGWYLRATPSLISSTTTGYVHEFTLDAKVDDSAVDYAVVVGIRCTRYDTFGSEMGESFLYLPLKAAPTNFIKANKLEETTKIAAPKSMIYFDVDITNEGYYKDVFQFELEEENGLMGLVEQQAIVMESGETKKITIGILTPEKLFDPGTPNQIHLYVSSSGNATKTLVGSFVVITKGIYVSPLVGLIAAPIIIVLIVVFLLLFWYKDKNDKELFGKPTKPWLIPEEKKYLKELKGKNVEEYKKILQMMQDEYKSALLWYDSYRKAMKKENTDSKDNSLGFLSNPLRKLSHDNKSVKKDSKEQKKKELEKTENPKKKEKVKSKRQETEIKSVPKKKNNLAKFFKQLIEKEKTTKEKSDENDTIEQKTKETRKEEKIKPETQKTEEISHKTIIADKEKSRKEKALLKIKRKQEKQRRKLKK
ncbi:MAG: hypothetical protein U9R21_00880 [Candidatus Thermoplasmatota archaeon]|nr:hypothetical protein [Candidatus Thermoplasmatota archaeon]